jgi:hypothetical protein
MTLGKCEALDPVSPISTLRDKLKCINAVVRANVEHALRAVERQFSNRKTGSRRPAKNSSSRNAEELVDGAQQSVGYWTRKSVSQGTGSLHQQQQQPNETQNAEPQLHAGQAIDLCSLMTDR